MAMLGFGLIFASSFSPADRPIVKITGIDTVAYYGTAHSILFDQDFDLSNQFKILQPVPSRWNAPVPQTGLPSAPFPIGFSILQLPFLVIGVLLEFLFAPTITGYSAFSKTAWFMGVLFYTAWGLNLTLSLLREISQAVGHQRSVGESACIKATLLLWPATTLGYYTVSPVPHAVSFFIVSATLWAWWQTKSSNATTRWACFGLAAGMMFLCRWQDALLLVIPVGWELRRWMTEGGPFFTTSYWRSRLACLLMFLLVVTVQTLQWHQVYGHWITIPQGGDFLHWPPSHIPQVLASSQHGWLSWTPIVGLGLVGLVSGFFRAPWLMLLIGLAMCAEISLIGAVSTWHGDRSFGMRYLTSLTPMVGIGLMLAFSMSASKTWQRTSMAVALSCAAFTLLFAAQYRLDLVPENQRLSRHEYWSDKFNLPRAIARHRAAQLAERKLHAGDPHAAWHISQSGAQDFGDNAALIDAAKQATQAAGEPGWMEAVIQREQSHQQTLMP